MRGVEEIGLVQVDMDPVNHCDPQLIDLFGAKDRGPGPDVLQDMVSQKNTFFLTISAENPEAGGTPRQPKIKPNHVPPSSVAVSNILNH